ncbi:hypothetical protein CCACVL1_11576 [Corchorus capsularis]|uniref:Uncharacterized protein n=1 Tax=Corchorus capsularis TaxID=210143 RepID=A0A1R3IKC8_COCAP|nr:hypothetical protein CCACVL1_11576 [Corchorus capsularis]
MKVSAMVTKKRELSVRGRGSHQNFARMGNQGLDTRTAYVLGQEREFQVSDVVRGRRT